MSRRIPDIENLRAIAILLVLVQHLQNDFFRDQLAWLRPVGDAYGFWIGVDLFFAVSGYVIARDLLPRLAAARDSHSFAAETLAFWVRRAWRLLPSAWLWLLLMLLASVCYNHSGVFRPVWSNVEASVAAVFYLANFRFAHTFGAEPYGASFVFWSLSLEEQFYLLLPFAALLFRRWLPVALGAAVLLQVFRERDILLMALRTDAILLGVLIAIAQRHAVFELFRPTFLAHSRLLRAALLFGLMFGAGVIASPNSHIVGFRVGAVALICAALVAVAAYDRGYLSFGACLDRLLGYIGARSYAIYLIHIPAIYFVRESVFRRGIEWATVPPAPLLAATLALILVLAECNYRWVEQPLRRRGARIAERIAARRAEATEKTGDPA